MCGQPYNSNRSLGFPVASSTEMRIILPTNDFANQLYVVFSALTKYF